MRSLLRICYVLNLTNICHDYMKEQLKTAKEFYRANLFSTTNVFSLETTLEVGMRRFPLPLDKYYGQTAALKLVSGKKLDSQGSGEIIPPGVVQSTSWNLACAQGAQRSKRGSI